MSLQVIADGLRACADCALAIANDDYSGMDDEREDQVRTAVHHLYTDGYPVIGDELGFSWQGCDCCHSGLGGDMYELSILGAR